MTPRLRITGFAEQHEDRITQLEAKVETLSQTVKLLFKRAQANEKVEDAFSRADAIAKRIQSDGGPLVDA